MKLFTKYRKVISILRDALLGRYYRGKFHVPTPRNSTFHVRVQTQSRTVSHLQNMFEKFQKVKHNDHTKDILTKLLLLLFCKLFKYDKDYIEMDK